MPAVDEEVAALPVLAVYHRGGTVENGLQSLLALPQRLLRTLALGDVAGDNNEPLDVLVLPDIRGIGDVHVLPPVSRKLYPILIADLLPAKAAFTLGLNDRFKKLSATHLRHRMPNQLLAGLAKGSHIRIISGKVDETRVQQCHHVIGTGDDVLVPTQFLFGLFALGDVQADRNQAGNLAVTVLQRPVIPGDLAFLTVSCQNRDDVATRLDIAHSI